MQNGHVSAAMPLNNGRGDPLLLCAAEPFEGRRSNLFEAAILGGSSIIFDERVIGSKGIHDLLDEDDVLRGSAWSRFPIAMCVRGSRIDLQLADHTAPTRCSAASLFCKSVDDEVAEFTGGHRRSIRAARAVVKIRPRRLANGNRPQRWPR
jgi:hypothetical protein